MVGQRGKQKDTSVKPSVDAPFGKRDIALLNALCHTNRLQQKVLLRTADEQLVKCICECALNVLKGVVGLKPGIKNRLKKHKSVLRQLAAGSIASQRGAGRATYRKKYSWKAKKRLMLQKGCGVFLPLLLAPIISNLVGKLFGNKK